MDIKTQNSNAAYEAKAQRPETLVEQEVDLYGDEEQRDLDESRKIGEELGAQSIESAKPVDSEQKAIQALTGIANIGRKVGSKALNTTGFVGISVAALSYIMFRLKIVAAALAAPALGAFYIANNLKKSAKESEEKSGLISDPKEIIKHAKDDSTYLEKNFRKVVAAMVKVSEMNDKDPKKAVVLKDLRKVAKKVSAKRTELLKIDKSSNMLLKIKHFMDIYDSVKVAETQSELEAAGQASA